MEEQRRIENQKRQILNENKTNKNDSNDAQGWKNNEELKIKKNTRF